VSRGFGYATLPSRILYHKCAKLYHNTKWKGFMMQLAEAKPNHLLRLTEEKAEEARKLKQKELWAVVAQKAKDETAAQHRVAPPELKIRAPPTDRFLTKRVVMSKPVEKMTGFGTVRVLPAGELSLKGWDKAVDLNVMIDEMYTFGKGKLLLLLLGAVTLPVWRTLPFLTQPSLSLSLYRRRAGDELGCG